MPNVIYKYEIPDATRPIPEDQRRLGPSGHLVPFEPAPARADQIIGRCVDEVCPNVGTYGMGGPGFFGLRFGSEWLVIAIWGASDWLSAHGRSVGDPYHLEYGRPRPWLADWSADQPDELSQHIVGQKIRDFDVRKHALRITLENGFDLTIEETSDRRPLFQGSRQPRQFAVDDDLRRAVFIAPTAEIWV